MWVPSAVLDWFHISKLTVESQREDLAAVRAERDALKAQVVGLQANFNWLTTRVNSLEVERAQLIKKAFNIDMPVPEIVRPAPSDMKLDSHLFEDVGDDIAKQLGMPVYGK